MKKSETPYGYIWYNAELSYIVIRSDVHDFNEKSPYERIRWRIVSNNHIV